jgi:hypothetical protein
LQKIWPVFQFGQVAFHSSAYILTMQRWAEEVQIGAGEAGTKRGQGGQTEVNGKRGDGAGGATG